MHDSEKVVVRFSDGRVIKGFLRDFSPDAESFRIAVDGEAVLHDVALADLKAVFFVKTFEGNHEYRDRKAFGLTRTKGHRVFVKFSDGESLVGFLDGPVPWPKGFFLSRQEGGPRGFFLQPADDHVNNVKVFVVTAAVSDVTVVP